MSYDNPQRETYVIPSSAFGAANEAVAFIGPPGKTGIVRDIIRRNFRGHGGHHHRPGDSRGQRGAAISPTPAPSRHDRHPRQHRSRYALSCASLISGPGNTGGVPPVLSDFAGHVALETARIPADTAFFISGTAGVGGAPAGTARREVIIDWF
jgi:hypothetical protein